MTVIVICSQQFMQCQSSEQVCCHGRDIISLNFISQVICTARFPADAMRCDFFQCWFQFVFVEEICNVKENGRHDIHV